ncbi:hypothetical protein [Piscibacillus salipiscarius]|uniref:hypothetical protein n=1 Tax=Piscibacillus salipiscarius TaxID=299480 RepID=UPI0006D20BF1|nr:hypothetical protein [Piscibacillus salipiscarius]
MKNLDINPEKYNYKVIETEDENLLSVNFRDGHLFIDVMNPRFWVIHTAIKAEHSDLFHSILLKQKNMDSVWLPIPFLKDLVKYGEIYGIGMSFTELLNREERDKLLFENQDTLKLDIRRLYVKEMLQALTHSELRMAAGLNKISILNYSDEDSDNYIIDDITYAGKITGRGTSFSKHLFLTHNVLEEYENSVNLIEDNFSFNYDLDSYKISGAPITINLNRKNINIYKLVETLFSGKKPFQLWGIPDWRSENYCYVSAVDLHLGNFGKQIHFEITSSTIKVILPKSSCGNSVARLITNIHQSIDATSSIKGGKNHDIFTI